MHKIKIAHVTTADVSLKYLLLNQLIELRKSGFLVYGVSTPGPYAAQLAEYGIMHIPVTMKRRMSPVADLIALWRLCHVFRKEQFLIVHTHTPKAGLLGQLAAKLVGVPIIVNTLHGFYFHDASPMLSRGFYVAMERIAAFCSDVILSQNREDMRTAIEERICAPDKIKRLGNGIDIERFDRKRIEDCHVQETRGNLGIPRDCYVVGFVGRLVREKGLIDLLKAIPRIIKVTTRVRFLIVGPLDNVKKDAFHPDDAKAYGVSDFCIFTGMREDMPELYASMDVLVLPSYREGFPRAPMEAAAMGVPIVVTDIRGCREVVEDGVNGYKIQVGDIVHLADRIVDLLLDPGKRQCMSTRARTIAAENFDERIVFERVKREYARLLNEKIALDRQ